jgi:hypothetical protein
MQKGGEMAFEFSIVNLKITHGGVINLKVEVEMLVGVLMLSGSAQKHHKEQKNVFIFMSLS